MLFFLLASHFLVGHGQAAPVATISSYGSEIFVPRASACNCNGSNQRSIWDIIWSCFTTIFACTWIAVHPNVPALDDSYWRIMRRRMKLMFWAVIAPETVIYWAIRQWLGARRTARECQEHGWTKTHGFFIQMGGFMLYDGRRPLRPLSFDELQSLHKQNRVEWPTINEAEIRDRSKGDFLAKGFVILQTSWFAAQCIARGIKGMVITELEIVTLGFTLLNGIMYFFWWNKPLDVQIPVPVQILPEVAVVPGDGRDDKAPSEKLSSEAHCTERMDALSGDKPALEVDEKILTADAAVSDRAKSPQQLPEKCVPQGHHDVSEGANLAEKPKENKALAVGGDQKELQSTIIGGGEMRPSSSTEPRTFLQSIQYQIEEGGTIVTLWKIFIYRPFIFLVGPLRDMGESKRSTTIDSSAKRVHTFYAVKMLRAEERYLDTFVMVIAILFGGVHCIAWAFNFPTTQERIAWRVAALFITALPAAFMILLALPMLWPFLEQDELENLTKIQTFIVILVVLPAGLSAGGILLYIPARLSLLIQALIELRALPEGAYDTVNWTTFIPHL